MTLSIPFLTALRTWFVAKPEVAAPPQESAPSGLIKLHQMLMVTGQRANDTSCKLVATEIGETQLVFKSNTLVRQDELLGIELLLPGLGPLKVTGKVEWVLHSSFFYSGQLNLWTTPEQRLLLAEFVRRQREGRR